MSGKYLLDTNIIIGLFASDQAFQARIEKVESIFIPSLGRRGDEFPGRGCAGDITVFVDPIPEEGGNTSGEYTSLVL